MSKIKHQPPVHISVTKDFLKTLPCLDISNEDHLRAALYAVGINIEYEFETKNGVSEMLNCKVRCADKPYMYRTTTVYAGTMRKDYPYEKIYKDGFLDVGSCQAEELCTELPYDIPVELKANIRKYTKKLGKEDFATFDDINELDDQFNGTIGLGAA